MNRMVKVFCKGKEQKNISKGYRIIEYYDGFVLADIPQQELAALSQKYPVEDITDIYTLWVGGQKIDTSIPRFEAAGKTHPHPAYKGVRPLSPGPHHYLVQFIGPIKEEWLKKVKNAGGKPRTMFADFAYIVRADEKILREIARLPFVRWIGHLPHKARIASSALNRIGRKSGDIFSELPRTRVIPGVYVVDFFDSDDIKKASSSVRKAGARILEENIKGKIMILELSGGASIVRKKIEALSAIHGVRSIRERSLKRISNDVAAQIMATASSMGNNGPGLSGKNEYIGICDTGIDTGDSKTIHKDFAKRIAYIKSYPITQDFTPYINNPEGDDGPADFDSGHGTHVAGSVLGNGTASIGLPGLSMPIRGLAYKAKLVFQAVEQEIEWKNPNDASYYGRYLLAGIPNNLARLFEDAYKRRVRIHSNSWGGGDPGAYDNQCEQLDRFVWEHKDFCILVAAGNDGTDKDGDGKINPISVTSPSTAKNCITVGASENQRTNFNTNTYGGWWPQDYPSAPFRNDPMSDNPAHVAAFSSRGPTADNRYKPDVVAPGTFILSTRSTMIAPNNKAWGAFPQSRLYFYMGGTSMATPLTAGAVALIREYLRKTKRIKRPTAALLKASLIAGAVRLKGYAPDENIVDTHQGYGRINIDGIISPSGSALTEFIEVKPGLRTGGVWPLDVNIQSGDAPFKVVLAYSDYPGPSLVNNLNLIVYSPDGKRFVGNQPEGSGMLMDTRNNVEVVHIQRPIAGKWQIEVVGSNVPEGHQDFSIVFIGHWG